MAEHARHLRSLFRTDLYALIRYGFNRPDFDHPWLFERCREVQKDPYGYLDLWAREHRKSTIITFGHSILEILASHGEDPILPAPVTIGIFSHTRPIAKAFLRQIKRELEMNKLLQELFPDILWTNPDKEAPSWSEDGGIIVKRNTNPKEATVEAWGLVDGQPVGKHFSRLVYDDVVTLKSVTTPEMIEKTTEAWALSLNLGTDDGERKYIGTRYHYNDTYREIMKRGAAIPRIHAGTEDGELDGDPVLFTPELWEQKVREMGPYIAACQLLQNPKADRSQGFQRTWLRFYEDTDGSGMNRYVIVDPANEKKKTSDYTAMVVIGLGPDNNYYLLDAVYDRLNLAERTSALFYLHRKWRPLGVGYEKYGKDSDIQHIEHVMNERNYRFDIIPLGGSMAKTDRIKRLIPVFYKHRFYLPPHLYKTNYEGKSVDLVSQFIEEEYDPFPVPVHDDFLDALSRILDTELGAIWPKITEAEDRGDRYARQAYTEPRRRRSWRTA